MFKIIKGMTLKQKIEYIWTYYKIHIIVIIISIFFIFGLLNFYIFNPPPKDFLSVSFLDDYISDDNLEKLNNQLNSIVAKEDGNVICTSNSFFESENENLNYVQTSRLMALSMTNQLDIVICSEDKFDNLYPNDFFSDLTDYLDENTLNSLSLIEKNGKILGIEIKDSEVLKNINYDYKNKILSVASSSERKDATIRGIHYILN